MSREERGEFVEVTQRVVGMTEMRAFSDVPESMSPDDAIAEGYFNARTEPDGSAYIWPAVIAGERLACSDATRRLSKDHEALPETEEARIHHAIGSLMLARPAR